MIAVTSTLANTESQSGPDRLHWQAQVCHLQVAVMAGVTMTFPFGPCGLACYNDECFFCA